MQSWDPNRVAELVHASATKAVRGTVEERLEGAREWSAVNRLNVA
jgi:hypothetical protein